MKFDLDPVKALQEMSRVSKPKGITWISDLRILNPRFFVCYGEPGENGGGFSTSLGSVG